MNSTRRLAGGSLILLLCACTSFGTATAPRKTYDLGLASAAGEQRHAAVSIAVPDIEAAPPLDSNAFGYRLNYSAANQPRTYADSEWSTAPANLITRAVRIRLADQFYVAQTPFELADFTLLVTLDEFTQVFDSPQASAGVVRLRATITRDGRIVAQRTFSERSSALSADAAGGASALGEASHAALEALAGWTDGVVREHSGH